MSVHMILKQKLSRLISVSEHDVFLTIAQKLTANNIGIVVVLNGLGGVDGIVSERDLVRAVAKLASAALVQSAKDMMTKKVEVCSPDDTELHVVRTMVKKHIRHMPVVSNGKAIGVVSLGDTVMHRLTHAGHMRLEEAADRPLGSFSRHLGSSAKPKVH